MGIPNLNLVYEDEDGIVICHYFNDKYILHSDYYKEFDKNFLKKIKSVNKEIELAFKNRGIDTIYTWAETEEQSRYNKFLGFIPTGDKVEIENYDKEVIEYKKEL